MAMTKREVAAKTQVMRALGSEGYPTYANLLDLFDLNLTQDPNTIAYMIPSKAVIVVNEGLDIDDVSLVIRHEILHEYLDHAKRLEAHTGKKSKTSKEQQIRNIAADYEISNLAYTDRDKITATHIRLNDQVLRGLVTEYDHPEWQDMSVEEMYDELSKSKNTPDTDNMDIQIGDTGDQQMQELEDIERQANDVSKDMENAKNQNQPQNQDSDDSDYGDEDNEDSITDGGGGGLTPIYGDEEYSDSDDDFEDSEDTDWGDSESDGNDDQSEGGNPITKSKSKASDESDKLEDQADKVQQEADKISEISKAMQDSIEKHQQQDEDEGKIFRDAKDTRYERSLDSRIAKIKKMLDSATIKSKIVGEATYKVQKERQKKQAATAQKYSSAPMARFKASLNKFLQDEVKFNSNNSWKKFNKKYAGSGLIKPGVSRKYTRTVPTIAVYYDRSGSWEHDEAKKRLGESAISGLARYEKNGDIQVNLYYFDTEVKTVDIGLGGGTSGDCIIQHIHKTNPDNVIILTDSDIKDCNEKVIVPGGVWLLFAGGESQNLIDHFEGKKTTKIFRLE